MHAASAEVSVATKVDGQQQRTEKCTSGPAANIEVGYRNSQHGSRRNRSITAEAIATAVLIVAEAVTEAMIRDNEASSCNDNSNNHRNRDGISNSSCSTGRL